MRAGAMDRKITIQSRAVTQDNQGSPVETWSTFASVWAQKSDIRGQVSLIDDKETGISNTKFSIRYLSGLNMQMRISYDGIIYHIDDIAEIGRRDGHDIYVHATAGL